MDNHFRKLEQDHSDLDDQIKDAAHNDIEVQRLKRLKLAKKDEMNRYSRELDLLQVEIVAV